ncbi:MAG: GTPase ObgE [Chlamydiae bacterium]|nr:GTPase ObgE [Chlamydiota bacterium]
MFIYETTISLTAGSGGNGVVAWTREKFIPKGGPCGGNGGNGASIVLRVNTQIPSLESYRNQRIIVAENGHAGGANLRQGRSGKNLVLDIPCGTIVRDAKTKEILYDCTEDKEKVIICKGGKGGKGNDTFKSPTNQAPNTCTEGTPGESREIHLELKLIADVGLVGMPNAGKSTFLSKITHVKVKIAPYPFTTLHPNLSFIQFDDFSRVLVADIPGIIKDAHDNRGLGLSFLKHVERTSVLVFIIDISGQEVRDPFEDFTVLRNELKLYSEEMLQKPFLVVLNKIDMDDAEENAKAFREKYPFDPSTLFEISAMNVLGFDPLIARIKELAQKDGKRF